MSNLSNSATKKRDELGVIDYNNNYNNKATAFERGFDAGYEVGRDEMNQQVQLLEDALKIYASAFTNDRAYVSGKFAKQALESLANMRGEK